MLRPNNKKKSFKVVFCEQKGFTLIEILVYALVFGVSAIFLVAILTSVTRTQLRQSSMNEVNEQLSFVSNTLQRLVRESSLIELEAGVTTSTLVLRMTSSSLDKTFVYASSSVLYLEQGSSTIGSVTPVLLTNDKVKVSNFSVTKYENPGGLATVQFDITMEANVTNPQGAVSRVWRSAVARVTAATFDSNLLPNASNIYDIGNSTYRWKSGYFSSGIGVGVSAPLAVGIKSAGDIVITSSTAGLVLTKPDGTCVRITVNSSGNIATSSPFACP